MTLRQSVRTKVSRKGAKTQIREENPVGAFAAKTFAIRLRLSLLFLCVIAPWRDN
jgi:hypothetical protein